MPDSPILASPAALELRGVGVERWSAQLGRNRHLLTSVEWVVGRGEHWIVLGPNGAGKTTLLNMAAAVSQPSTGTVHVLGARLGATDVRALRERIGLVDARLARQLKPSLSGLEIVLTGAFGSIALQRSKLTDAHRERAAALLTLIGAADLGDRRFEDCSQGERQRLLLARSLMPSPELLLLDEPTTGLDLPSRERLIQALVALAADDPTLPTVTVTHHLEEIPPTASHVLLLTDGHVLTSGEIADVLTSDHVSECFGVPVDVGRRAGRWSAAVRV
ncbi:MAG: ATP-binding cassette domain-containing protein [Patulibacter sp.]|nr:ATP-binding cassette domain-containing protein [Patulibacter sp.]